MQNHPNQSTQTLHREDWQRPADGAPMTRTITKRKHGIVQRMYLHGELIQTTFSKRPYRLGQACDGTIDDCVYGLLLLFCRDRHLSLEHLLAEAYPHAEPFSKRHQEAALERALAQGIHIPDCWDDEAVQGLLDSLTEINHHSLVGVLTDKIGIDTAM